MSEPVTVGDLVTPGNVASLPVGTIVRWTWEPTENDDGGPAAAIRVGPDAWEVTGQSYMDVFYNDRGILGEYEDDVPPAFIAYLPEGQ